MEVINFFDRLKSLNSKRQIEWDSNGDLDLCYKTLEFMTESGELGEQCKKLIRQTKGLKGNTTDITKIKQEIGDVIITLSMLCDTIEKITNQKIDIEECTKNKFNETSMKYNFKTTWES